MEAFYWFFILSVVIATFFVIFTSLSKKSYWVMGIIAVLYALILTWSSFN